MLVSRTRSSRDPGAVPRGQWHFDGCSQSMKRSQILCTCRENIGRGTTYRSTFCFVARLTAFLASGWGSPGPGGLRRFCGLFCLPVKAVLRRTHHAAKTRPRALGHHAAKDSTSNGERCSAVSNVGRVEVRIGKTQHSVSQCVKKHGRIATFEITASKKSDFV